MTRQSEFPKSARRPVLWLIAFFAIILVAPALLAEDDPGQPISIDLRECQVGDAIRILMQSSGANIILDGDVAGSITCKIDGKPLDEILDFLTMAKGLHWHKKNGVYVISKYPVSNPAPAPGPVQAALPPPPPTTGPIDLSAGAALGAPAVRAKTHVDNIGLQHMDARVACDLLKHGQATSSVDLMASMMRDNGSSTTGIPQFYQNNNGGGGAAGGSDLYNRLTNGGGFGARPPFPGQIGGGGGAGFPQFPGGAGGGMMGGAGGGMPGAGAAGGAGGGGGGSPLLPDGVEDVIPYDLTNSIIVRGTDEGIAELREIISKYLDVAPKQVRIEAEFLTVNMNDESLLGFNWSITDGQTTIDAPLAVGGDLSVRYASGNFSLALQALKKTDRGRTIIAPRITTMNNRMATIASSQGLWYTNTQTVVNPFGGATLTNKQPVQIPVTIQLAVYPRINGDDSVTMMLFPMVQDVMGFSEGPNGEQLPIIQSQFISLPEIRVKDGETLAIGGLVRRQDSKTSRKLPFFSDLPLIGNLFRTRQDHEQDTELLIFLTPKVLPSDESPALLPSAGAVAPTPQAVQ